MKQKLKIGNFHKSDFIKEINKKLKKKQQHYKIFHLSSNAVQNLEQVMAAERG